MAMAISKANFFAVVAAVSGDPWESWKQDYGRVYNGGEDEEYRRSVFDANMVLAVELQDQNPMAEFGVTQFSDRTPEELREMLNYSPSDDVTLPESNVRAVPEDAEGGVRGTARRRRSQDWTGVYTTPVKNQGRCGSCWAFSATEQVEADACREHGKLIELAPQELVDCKSSGVGSHRIGCHGGSPSKAYGVIEALGGMQPESSYKYTATNGTCKVDSSKFAVKVTGYSVVGAYDEDTMKSYVDSTGPLSVCVDATIWPHYKGGILTSCDMHVDHCVQIVGHGHASDDVKEHYWKVRNSWGTSWGESGHIRVQIGGNLCNISHKPTKVSTKLALVDEISV